jgi:cellulose biosynthesis protein BcsQ
MEKETAVPQKNCKVIAFANNKGGVGKTSCSVNLAIALTNIGHEVLLIDTDNQCDSTVSVIEKGLKIDKCMYEVFSSQMKNEPAINIDEVIYPTRFKNLYILPNVEESSGIDMELGGMYPKSLLFLKNAIYEGIKSNFDYCIIDTPPALSIYLGNALNIADSVIIPIDSESGRSLKGLKRILDLIETTKITTNENLKFLRILINRVDNRTTSGRIIIKSLEKAFQDDQIFKTKIPTSSALRNSELSDVTLFDIAQTTKACQQFRMLAKEVDNIFN